MPEVIYLTPAGETVAVTVNEGATVMRTAVANGVRGIIGECGGQAMCATCHVYVRSVAGELPPIGEDEEEMLECTVSPREEGSRLGCQLRAGAFDKIVVQIPEQQV